MPFNLQPHLENELVRIRPLAEDDIESLYQVAKDPLIWEQHTSFDRYQRPVFESFFQDSIASQGALLIFDKALNEIIGSSRFKRIAGVDSAIEIGWSFLARNYWGGKYNRSFKTLMLEHAFATLEDVLFYIALENLRSQKAVKKLGGIRITAAAYPHLIQQHSDTLTYKINRQDWYQYNQKSRR